MTAWSTDRTLSPGAASCFGSLDNIFSLTGECVSRDKVSDVLRVEVDGSSYYIKRYYHAGNTWRKWLGFPRIVREWKNLQYFSQWQIPTADVVAHGAQYTRGIFQRGAMVTAAIPETQDLASLAKKKSALLKNSEWISNTSSQLANITRRLHQNAFTHNDLKWRNVLVDNNGKVFLIDCPNGLFWIPPFLQYRIIKDLACLDKVAKYHLSRTQRLRFYQHYVQKAKLDNQDKRKIRKILAFFDGRE